jgi:PAS domain S-box-containing protein
MLVENLPVGVYITTPEGELLDANPGLLVILGVESLDELRKYSASDLYVDPARREEENALLARQGSVKDFEIELKRVSDGGIRTVLDTCYGVKDFKTDELLYHGILTDITERRALEDEIRKLNK